MKGIIIVAGIGPGSMDDVTPAVLHALSTADAVVGYKYYFQFIAQLVPQGCQCIDTGMKRERERAEQAFLLAGSDGGGHLQRRCRHLWHDAADL